MGRSGWAAAAVRAAAAVHRQAGGPEGQGAPPGVPRVEPSPGPPGQRAEALREPEALAPHGAPAQEAVTPNPVHAAGGDMVTE